MRAVERRLANTPSLGRGPGSWCALEGAVLDGFNTPMIDGHQGAGFDMECRRLAAELFAGREVTFHYSCFTAFTLCITPEEAIDGGFPDWVGPGRTGYARVTKKIGSKGKETTYYHPLGKGGSWEYIAEKHRLREHDARTIDYVLAAIGEALRELAPSRSDAVDFVTADEDYHYGFVPLRGDTVSSAAASKALLAAAEDWGSPLCPECLGTPSLEAFREDPGNDELLRPLDHDDPAVEGRQWVFELTLLSDCSLSHDGGETRADR